MSAQRSPEETAPTTVYYDGACPLCAAEISLYRKADAANALTFVDVSKASAPLPPWLDRSALMRRFHVRTGDGRLVSGAEAFVALWERLPKLRWAAKIGRLPPVLMILEGGYRLFLPLRPLLSRAAGALVRGRGASRR